jgi:drug/metabolite transporter (DMT)-like permease
MIGQLRAGGLEQNSVKGRGSNLSFTTLLFFVAAMATLGFADFATKQTSGRISPALGTWIYAATAMLPALVWTLWSRLGVLWAVLTGLAFGVFAGVLFYLFSQGVNLSVGTPIIRLGGITFAALLGIIVLREPFDFQSLAGFVLAAAGILLIAMR